MATYQETLALIQTFTSRNLDTFMEAVRYRESTGNYQNINGLYVGAYQLSRIALEQIGYVSSAGNANDSSTWVWLGRNGVDSLEEFLGTGDASESDGVLNQDLAFILSMHDNWRQYRIGDNEFYGDQTLTISNCQYLACV